MITNLADLYVVFISRQWTQTCLIWYRHGLNLHTDKHLPHIIVALFFVVIVADFVDVAVVDATVVVVIAAVVIVVVVVTVWNFGYLSQIVGSSSLQLPSTQRPEALTLWKCKCSEEMKR